MRITEVRALAVGHKLRTPLRWGSLEVTHKGSVWIRIATDEGIVGWGEAGFGVDYYSRTKPIVDEMLAPILIGRDPLEVARIWEEMYRATHKWGRRGVETYAVSGVDIALWDIMGKVCGQPVFRLLGG